MPINSKLKRSRNSKGQFLKNINQWVVKGNIAYCYLNGELLFFTDADLLPCLKGYSFTKHANGYSGVRINNKTLGVHRLISNPNPEELVDHINRNKKDNRRCNLRNTNKSVNAFNSKLKSTNTSGVRGVFFRKDTKRWCAEIKKDYKKIPLGCYATLEEAVAARKEAELKYYGN